MTRRVRIGLVAAIVAVAATACTGAGPSTPVAGSGSGTATDGTTLVTGEPGTALERARSNGASPAQLAVLQTGTVTFEQYQEAVQRTMACIRTAGIDVVGGTTSDARGFPEINYSVAGSSPGRTDAQTLALADTCIARNSQYVEELYQTSPAAVEARDARFAAVREALVACVRKNGGDVDAKSDRGTVVRAAAGIQQQGGPDCFAEVGYQP